MKWESGKIVIFGALLVAVVCACVAVYFWRADKPNVPKAVENTVRTQEAVRETIHVIQTRRIANDKRIEEAAETARHSVDTLSADAVVAELNALLDELRRSRSE